MYKILNVINTCSRCTVCAHGLSVLLHVLVCMTLQMAAALSLNSVATAVCVYMLYQEVINFSGYLASSTERSLFNPLHPLMTSKSQQVRLN